MLKYLSGNRLQFLVGGALEEPLGNFYLYWLKVSYILHSGTFNKGRSERSEVPLYVHSNLQMKTTSLQRTKAGPPLGCPLFKGFTISRNEELNQLMDWVISSAGVLNVKSSWSG